MSNNVKIKCNIIYNSSKRMKYFGVSRIKGKTYYVHGLEDLPIKLSIFSKLTDRLS